MDQIKEILKSISSNNYDVGSSHWVDVTHINNPSSFYVRPILCRSLMPILHSYGEQFLPNELQLRQNILFQSKSLQCFVRGQVFFIQNENGEIFCDIYAPDYGCFEKSVPLERIRKPCQAMDVPPLAVHCQLADCKPHDGTWSRKVIECMEFFVGKEKAKLIVRGKTPEVLIVELVNSCPDDIATLLALCGYTTLGYGDNEISRFTSIPTEIHYFSFKTLNVNEELCVRVQAGDSLKSFYVAQLLDYKQYLNKRENFTYSSMRKKPFETEDIKVGMPVAVLINTYTKYERAIIKEITVPESRVKVHLVDWGKILEVPFTRLKPMAKYFFSYPATAIFCKADDTQVWNNDLHKLLHPGCEFKITIKSVGENFKTPHVVTITPHSATL